MTSYTYDAANRLTSVNGVAYTWDNNGNLTNDGVRTYAYDAANRLTAVSGSSASSFAYDGLGNRTSMTVGGATTRYALDVAGGLPEVIAATGGATTQYLQVQGQVLAQYDSGTWGYVAPDALGSVRQLVDPAGAVTLAQSYDPFGNLLTSAGSASSVFGYTGEQVDASTGLVYLRARYYSSYQGIFLSRDLVDSEPPYQYVRENPVNLVDSSGLVPTREGINRGDYSYSCNCGWIDWGHANGESASALIDKLERLNSTTEPIDISAIAFARYGYQGAVTLWISKEPNLPQDELTRVALGVFKAIQLQVEEVQGNVRIGPVPLPASGTYFSEEDLPSDLIGFYKAVWERAGVPASWSEIISRACKVLNKADSLEVFEAYQNELSQGDMGEGGFVRWRNWQGRLADSCTIQGKCGSIAGRRWPALFSTIQEYNAEQGGKWHIESGKTCWGLWGCTTPLPRD